MRRLAPLALLATVVTAGCAPLGFVGRAIADPVETVASWSWPQIDLAGDRQFILGRHLASRSTSELELDLCPYDLADVTRSGSLVCTAPSERRAVAVPHPIQARVSRR